MLRFTAIIYYIKLYLHEGLPPDVPDRPRNRKKLTDFWFASRISKFSFECREIFHLTNNGIAPDEALNGALEDEDAVRHRGKRDGESTPRGIVAVTHKLTITERL